MTCFVKIIWLIIKLVEKKVRSVKNLLLKTLQSTIKKSFTFLKKFKDFKSKGTYTAPWAEVTQSTNLLHLL